MVRKPAERPAGAHLTPSKAGAVTPNDPKKPLTLSLTDYTRDMNINTTSAFAAAQQAALGFEDLPESAAKTFIYTGNCLNTTIMPALLDLGVGKTATAHIIQVAASSYGDRGFKYVDPASIICRDKADDV